MIALDMTLFLLSPCNFYLGLFTFVMSHDHIHYISSCSFLGTELGGKSAAHRILADTNSSRHTL